MDIMGNKNSLTVGEIQKIIVWLKKTMQREEKNLEEAVRLKLLDIPIEIGVGIEEIRELIDRLEQQQIQ